jgi:DHA1 family inner membrane transport protein
MAITAGYGWTITGPVGAATAIAGLLVYALAVRERRNAASRVDASTTAK